MSVTTVFECVSEHEPDSEDVDAFTSIDSLPDEVLLEIFAYVAKEQLVLAIPHVCARWHKVSSDASLYTNLRFTSYNIELEVAIRVLEMATSLKSLKVLGRSDTDEILLHIGAQHDTLETLELHNCQGTPRMMMARNMVSVFDNVLNHCSNIKRLSFKGTYCPNRNFYNDVGKSFSMLRYIDFGNTFFIHDETYCNIVNNTNIQIEELRSKHSQISDQMLLVVCLRFRESLRVAKLFCFRSTNDSLFALARCNNLHKLSLDRAVEFTDNGLVAIGAFPHLTSLSISESYGFTSQGWANFFGTPSAKKITRLKLSRCVYLDDNAVMSIAQLPHLQHLAIRDSSKITALGWCSFLVTSHVRHVTHLFLENCDNVDDLVANVVAHNMHALKVLSLMYCRNITEQGHLEVQQQIPIDCLYHELDYC